MKDHLIRLHEWQLNTVLPEEMWTFSLRNGYEAFDRKLSSHVRRVSKSRFKIPFDASFSWKPYGYWDSREVFIRYKAPPSGPLSLLSSARRSHFEGSVFPSDSGSKLVGSYKLTGMKRVTILMLIYVPVFLVVYGLISFPLLVWQSLESGDYAALLTEGVWFLAVLLASTLFWLVGYGRGRLHEFTTRAERKFIHDLLTAASR